MLTRQRSQCGEVQAEERKEQRIGIRGEKEGGDQGAEKRPVLLE